MILTSFIILSLFNLNLCSAQTGWSEDRAPIISGTLNGIPIEFQFLRLYYNVGDHFVFNCTNPRKDGRYLYLMQMQAMFGKYFPLITKSTPLSVFTIDIYLSEIDDATSLICTLGHHTKVITLLQKTDHLTTPKALSGQVDRFKCSYPDKSLIRYFNGSLNEYHGEKTSNVHWLVCINQKLDENYLKRHPITSKYYNFELPSTITKTEKTCDLISGYCDHGEGEHLPSGLEDGERRMTNDNNGLQIEIILNNKLIHNDSYSIEFDIGDILNTTCRRYNNFDSHFQWIQVNNDNFMIFKTESGTDEINEIKMIMYLNAIDDESQLVCQNGDDRIVLSLRLYQESVDPLIKTLTEEMGTFNCKSKEKEKAHPRYSSNYYIDVDPRNSSHYLRNDSEKNEYWLICYRLEYDVNKSSSVNNVYTRSNISAEYYKYIKETEKHNITPEPVSSTNSWTLTVEIAAVVSVSVAITIIVLFIVQARLRHRNNEEEHHYEDIEENLPDRKSKMDIANRPQLALPPEELEDNKPYIHYDTPYDFRIFRLGVNTERCPNRSRQSIRSLEAQIL